MASSSSSSRFAVTRGAFAYNTKSTVSILPGSMRTLPLEQDEQRLKRRDTFTACWRAVEKEVTRIISIQHDKVLDDLLHFILLTHKKWQSLHMRVLGGNQEGESSHCWSLLPPRLEVSSAVLVAGVNMPDHDVLFERLRSKIHAEASPYLVSLRAKDCNSGMKATMQKIYIQLTELESSSDQGSSDSDEERDQKPLATCPRRRRRSLCSMRLLCDWYRDAVSRLDTSHEVTRPPVVIIIEDFEAFQPNIVQDLILQLSPRLLEFPVVLVLGVATSVSVIHQLLPQHAAFLLSIRVFNSQQPSLTVAQIIKNILLTHQFPFKLGPKALNFLLHQFFYWNLSLVDFTRGLKCAMLEHFSWQPLSVLCGPASGAGCGFAEAICATPSMQRYIESLHPHKRLELLESESKLKVEVKMLLRALKQYHQTFYPLLCCLHHLTQSLPDAPLGRKLHELYLLTLEQNIVEQNKFKTGWKLVNMLSKVNITERVTLCIGELEEASLSSSGSVLQVLKDTLCIFETFQRELTELDRAPVSAAAPQSANTTLVSVAQETTGERKLRFQERLRQLASRTGPSPLELARTKLLKALLDVFTTHLRAPRELTLHEVFYYDQVDSLQLHLAPAPRSVIQTALNQPGYYLPGAKSSSDETISSDQPDICIIYQLHLECGKLINLYDLLQSFVAVVAPDSTAPDEEEGNKKKKTVDLALHARFIQAVAELQLLGFLKPTQRKTDHVQRLTWGPL